MLIIRDFECYNCGHIHEEIVDCDKEFSVCPKCAGPTRKIITVGSVYTGNEDTAWLKTVTEVVDKEGGPASQAFLKNPTRTNYRRWMKETGLRPFEPGEKPRKPERPPESKIQAEVMEKYRKRNSLEIR